jgi:hypothetical protein
MYGPRPLSPVSGHFITVKLFNDPEKLRKIAIALLFPIVILTVALVAALFWRTGALYNWTGEEQFSAQIKGLSDLAADMMRPRVRPISSSCRGWRKSPGRRAPICCAPCTIP